MIHQIEGTGFYSAIVSGNCKLRCSFTTDSNRWLQNVV